MKRTPILLLVCCGVCGGDVVLRTGGVVEAPVESVSPAGVRVGGASPRTIAWDRVMRVEGDMRRESLAFTELADAVWRARTRLSRGDIALAAPLFERLYAESDSFDGPTGLLIVEGTLACRMERDPAGAVEAWLTALGLRNAGVKLDGEPVATSTTDARTGLVPALPPFFSHRDPGAQLSMPDADADERARAFAELYEAALTGTAGEAVIARSADPAVELVRRLVAAQLLPLERQPALRERLDERLRTNRSMPAWERAWTTAAIGRSLLREEDEALRMEGVFRLMEVPAQFGGRQPNLSAVVLRDIVRTLEDLGRTEEATRLEAVLVESYPDHPAARRAPEASDDAIDEDTPS